MLVLSRKKGETIHIANSEIVITVVSVSGNRVKLGIEASKDLDIVRGEIRNESGKTDPDRDKR